VVPGISYPAGLSTITVVTESAHESSGRTAVTTTNLDEDCSPAAFRELLDALAEDSEPELESIDAALAVRELRLES
jgi:hypothetical protein